MTIALVNTTNISTRDLYNQLATSVTTLMAPTATGYGFAGHAVNTVTNTTLITLLEWQKLYYEANQIYNHITGNPIQKDPGDLPYAGSDRLLQAKHVNLIINAVNTATSNPYTAAPSQLLPLSIDDTSNSVWSSTINSVVDITLPDDIQAQYFFNLGCKIESSLSFRQVYPGVLEDQWIYLITQMQDIMEANPYNRSLYQLRAPRTFSTDSTVTGDRITLTYTPISAHQIRVAVSFIVGTLGANADSAIPKGLKVTHTCNTYCSVGSLPSPRPTGILVTTGFSQGGQSITPVIKTLQVDRPTINYSNMRQYDESAKETITLTNTGNTEVNIAGIIFSQSLNGQGPAPNVYLGPGWSKNRNDTLLLTLEPRASATVTVSYTSRNLGSFNNFIHFRSDCQNGNGIVAVKTKQVVKGPIFRAVLGIKPSIDVKNYHSIKNQVAIVTTNHVDLAYYNKDTCSLMWNGQNLINHPEIFTIDDSVQGGPIVRFNPESFVRFSGVTKATLVATIKVNCTSVSVPGAPSQHLTTSSVTTINLDVPPNFHLGDWVSPTSLNNSVVAMSYDFINAAPYLTIGVGLESNLLDGSGHLMHPLPSQVADGNHKLNLNSLGPDADPEWSNGVPLFKVNPPTWTQGDATTGFLYDYGVWFNADGKTPSGKLVTRRYVINIPEDGNYSWKFAADVLAYFAIDGNILGDTRQSATSSEAQAGYSGTISLPKGRHALDIAGANVFADLNRLTGFALTIQQQNGGQIVWTSLTPVRSRPTYVGWSEVYRIPLPSVGTGVPQTYYTGGYVVKDSGAVYEQYRYQDFFGDYARGAGGAASLFVIDDDGFGNLSIRTQYKSIEAGLSDADQTLDQLQYVSYYYNTLDFNSPQGQSYDNHARRVHNLEGPQGDGHQCHQFLGFDMDGNVVTRLTRYPGDGGYDPIPRYLVGSLNLASGGPGNKGKGPDASIAKLFKSLLTDPILWIAAVGYGLWTGGIACALINFTNFVGLGADTVFGEGIYAVSNWLIETFQFGGLEGGIFSSAAEGIGSLFSMSGAEILAYVPEVAVVLLVAYIALEYGGQIWHAITDAVTSIPIVGGVIQSVLDIGTSILQPIGQIFSCFDPEALVTMADGSLKKIKDIRVGDYVMSRTGQANRVIGIETPIQGSRLMYGFNSGPVFVSGEHRLLTAGGWASFDPEDPSVEKASDEILDKISIGTELITKDGSVLVTSVETEIRPYYYIIYNLIVDGDHTYIVEDLVTNNRGCVMTHAICEYYGDQPHDWYQLAMIRILRDQYILSKPELILLMDIYYNVTQTVVDRLATMDDRHIVYDNIKQRLDAVAALVELERYETAFDSLVDMMLYATDAVGITIPEYQEYYQLV
jgi:hypothetical protein